MMLALKKLGRNLFAILSSLQLAVIVLLSLAVVLAVGTFYESIYDAETAKHYVYSTHWFAGLLCLLGLNVLFAALSRWPWKRHHIGFLVTHLGILTLLGGSLVTLLKGYEGQMILAEGESGKRMTLQEAQLFFYDVSTAKLEQTSAEFRFDPPSPTQPWQAQMMGVRVQVDGFLPHAAEEIQVKADSDLENPALQVKIQGSRASLQEWIFSREFDRQTLSLGPATLSYLDLPNLQAMKQMLQDPQSFRGPMLVIDGKWIPVEPNLGKPLQVGRKTVTIDKYFSHAGVDQGELKNLGSDRLNPAVTLRMAVSSKEERHSVFAKFPQLPTVHGESADSVRPRLVDLPSDWNSSNNALLLARDESGSVFYALKAGGKWSEPARYASGAAIPTGWMDFNFSVSQDVPRARIEKVYRKVSLPKGQEGPPSAIHLVMGNQVETKNFWLARGETRDVSLGGKPYKVAYGLKSKPLGFEIKLDDFRMGLNEGTQNPSSFESQVRLIDAEQGVQKDHLIAMNEPLRHRKYKFFQASYRLNPDGPDFSVLAVAYDPGIFLKYLGSIIMVSGILLMFFFKPLFVQKRIAARKLQENEAQSERLRTAGLHPAKGDL